MYLSDSHIICEDIDPLILDRLDPPEILWISQLNHTCLAAVSVKRSVINTIKMDFKAACLNRSLWMAQWIVYDKKEEVIEKIIQDSIELTTIQYPNSKGVILSISSDSNKFGLWISNTRENMKEQLDTHVNVHYVRYRTVQLLNCGVPEYLIQNACLYGCLDVIQWMIGHLYDGEKEFVDEIFRDYYMGDDQICKIIVNSCKSQDMALIKYLIDLLNRNGKTIRSQSFDRIFYTITKPPDRPPLAVIQYIFDCRNEQYPGQVLPLLQPAFVNIVQTTTDVELARWMIQTAELANQRIDTICGLFTYMLSPNRYLEKKTQCLEMVQYLYELSQNSYGPIDLHAEDEEIFRSAWNSQNIPMIKWLIKITEESGSRIDINVQHGYLFRTAYELDNEEMVEILVKLSKQNDGKDYGPIDPRMYIGRKKDNCIMTLKQLFKMCHKFDIKYNADHLFFQIIHDSYDIDVAELLLDEVIAHNLPFDNAHVVAPGINKHQIRTLRKVIELSKKYPIDFIPDIYRAIELITWRSMPGVLELIELVFEYAKIRGKDVRLTDNNCHILEQHNTAINKLILQKTADSCDLGMPMLNCLLTHALQTPDRTYVKMLFDLMTRMAEEFYAESPYPSYHSVYDVKKYVYDQQFFYDSDMEEWIKKYATDFDIAHTQRRIDRQSLALDQSVELAINPFDYYTKSNEKD